MESKESPEIAKYLFKKDLTRDGDSTISGGRFIAETIKGYGVTHVFFMDTILRRGFVEMEVLGIRRVLAHSEKAAAYMADGYARVSHKPGICMAQSVGAANLAAGLQDAYLALSPVIAITGRKDFLFQYRHAYQEILHMPLFEPVTKYNVQVETGEQLPYLLRQAFREATSGAPGPVHMDLLGHVGQTTEAAELAAEILVEAPFTSYPSNRPEPEIERVQDAARLLEEAKRPVIVAGGGVIASSAESEVLELAERLSIPVVTSLNGKSVILDSHPLCGGVVGSYSRWCANKIVSEADLVLYVGSNTGDEVSNDWKLPKSGTRVIQIDIDARELGRSYANSVSLMGDAKVTVSKLCQLVTTNSKKTQWAEHAQEIVQEWRQEVEPLRNSDASPIRPERLCKEISDTLPSDGILVSDTGYSAIWTGVMVYLTHPGQSYIRAAGSMGWGFPASLGAKCGAPDRTVMCFTGDGGFWYHLSDLETAVRCGIKTVTVINNNNRFGQVAVGIDKAYGDRPGNREEMYSFREVNFARIAEEMGCLGIRVESPEKIRGALERALSSDLTAVVEVITDKDIPAPWAQSY
jgi:acetolactate synthase-1/2/3 large subunit